MINKKKKPNVNTDYIREPKEAIARLCALQAEVARNVVGYSEPNDCFCLDPERNGLASYQKGGLVDSTTSFDEAIKMYWRNSGKAISWIEKTVRKEIKKHNAIKAQP